MVLLDLRQKPVYIEELLYSLLRQVCGRFTIGIVAGKTAMNWRTPTRGNQENTPSLQKEEKQSPAKHRMSYPSQQRQRNRQTRPWKTFEGKRKLFACRKRPRVRPRSGGNHAETARTVHGWNDRTMTRSWFPLRGETLKPRKGKASQRTRRANDSKLNGHHNVCTYFPKDANGQFLQDDANHPCQIHRPPKRADGKSRPTSFGNLTVADHKILNLKNESRNDHHDAPIVQDRFSYRVQKQPCEK